MRGYVSWAEGAGYDPGDADTPERFREAVRGGDPLAPRSHLGRFNAAPQRAGETAATKLVTSVADGVASQASDSTSRTRPGPESGGALPYPSRTAASPAPSGIPLNLLDPHWRVRRSRWRTVVRAVTDIPAFVTDKVSDADGRWTNAALATLVVVAVAVFGLALAVRLLRGLG